MKTLAETFHAIAFPPPTCSSCGRGPAEKPGPYCSEPVLFHSEFGNPVTSAESIASANMKAAGLRFPNAEEIETAGLCPVCMKGGPR